MVDGPRPTYENVGPLVAAVDDLGGAALVTFRCPATGTEVKSQGEYPKPGIADKVGRVARAGALDRARIGLVRTVQRTAGTAGTLGLAVGETAARKAVAGRSDDQPRHSERATEGAVLSAFAEVADQFRWDKAGGRWVSRDAAGGDRSPFDAHLDAHPVTADYDRRMLARILATIVGAEGGTTEDERAMFAALAPGTDLNALIAQWAPAVTELEATQPGAVRETMVLLAWAVAVTDEQLSPRETELLDWYPAALGVAPARAAELRAIALRHVVEQTVAELARDGLDAAAVRAEVEPLGERIGLGAGEAASVTKDYFERNR